MNRHPLMRLALSFVCRGEGTGQSQQEASAPAGTLPRSQTAPHPLPMPWRVQQGTHSRLALPALHALGCIAECPARHCAAALSICSTATPAVPLCFSASTLAQCVTLVPPLALMIIITRATNSTESSRAFAARGATSCEVRSPAPMCLPLPPALPDSSGTPRPLAALPSLHHPLHTLIMPCCPELFRLCPPLHAPRLTPPFPHARSQETALGATLSMVRCCIAGPLRVLI